MLQTTGLSRLARRKSFQCLHKYEVKDWTPEENARTFGACFTPNGHGHNYELEAYFEGPLDPITGMIMNLIDVDRLLAETLAPINGKHLNFEVAKFRDQVPTTENLAAYLFERLKVRLTASGVRDVSVARLRLYESENLWVDVWP